MSPTENQSLAFLATRGNYLRATAGLLLQYPAQAILVEIWTETGNQVGVEGGDPLDDQLNDLFLALLERCLHVLVPFEWLGLAEEVAERRHVGRLDKAVRHLVDEPEPGADLTDVGWGGEDADRLDVPGCRPDPIQGNLKAGKFHIFSCKGELFR